MTDTVYSIVYERDNRKYSMRVICESEKEAEFHADSLGLELAGEIIAIIPDYMGFH